MHDTPFKKEIIIVKNWNKKSNDRITTYLKKMKVKGKAENVGNIQYETSKEWQKNGGHPKSFGKTDIIIGDKNISVKSKADHLIFSGAKGESKALFLSIANKYYKNKLVNVVNKIVKELDNMVGSEFTPTTIGLAKKTDFMVKKAHKMHQLIKNEINDLFTNDPKYSKIVIREMLTGRLKFGKNSPATADYLLYIEPIELISADDDEIFAKNTVDIRVDFKSQSASSHDENNIGTYRYWSVIQLIQKRLRIDESIDSIIPDIRRCIRNEKSAILMMENWNELLSYMGIGMGIEINNKIN